MTENKTRPKVLAVLLVALAAALANTVFVFGPFGDEAAVEIIAAQKPLSPLPPTKAISYTPLVFSASSGALDWRADVTVEEAPSGGKLLVLNVEKKNGVPLKDVTFEVSVHRHDIKAAEVIPLFKKDEKGRLTAPFDTSQPGVWEIRAWVMQGKDTIHFKRIITTP